MRTVFRKALIYALRMESELVLWKYKPRIIAITGSVGKTSTKDAVFAALSNVAYVRKSEKSYNSELGLPLTILGCPNGWNNPLTWTKNLLKGLWLFIWGHRYPNWLILEVGVGKPGDMKRTASWLKTDAVIITAIGETPSHIEFFDSRKHLIEEKSGLVKTLRKDGILILNIDDEAVINIKNKVKNRLVTYGFKADADVVGGSESILYDENKKPSGLIFRVDAGGVSLPVSIENVFGTNYIYASLATLALASAMKWNMVNAIERLRKYDVSPGRMRRLEGINGSLLIDDTYNSSPAALRAALKTLKEINSTGKKIAILGDMLELGKYTIEAHQEIGKIAKEIVDVLIAVGERAKAFKEGALLVGMSPDNIFQFSNSTEAGEFSKTFIKENDIVLIKGSQGMRMERVAEALLLHLENKKNLLVRQDKEWEK